MNQNQMNAAKEQMIEWLEHPQELGKAPSKIECAGEFDLYEMHYYIFKYQKGIFGKWLLGVCGGYEGDSLDHCGHVYSEMQEYVEETAKEDAIALVEYVRSQIMELAKKGEEKKEKAGNFVGFVLMKDATWSKQDFLKRLKEDWQIEDENGEEGIDKAEDEHPDAAVLFYEGSIIAVGFVPAPVSDGEAEFNAKNNFVWKEAVETVKQHKAHLMVTVLGKDNSPVDAGELFVKAVDSCCKQSGVIGVYMNETVYRSEVYQDFAQMMKDDLFPLYNLVWFGLYNGKNGTCGYTCGMRNFGYDELEVIDSSATAQEVGEFLSDVANYVILDDVLLQDGETIGFTAEQKLPITKSMGVAVEGNSLKIGFPE